MAAFVNIVPVNVFVPSLYPEKGILLKANGTVSIQDGQPVVIDGIPLEIVAFPAVAVNRGQGTEPDVVLPVFEEVARDVVLLQCKWVGGIRAVLFKGTAIKAEKPFHGCYPGKTTCINIHVDNGIGRKTILFAQPVEPDGTLRFGLAHRKGKP